MKQIILAVFLLPIFSIATLAYELELLVDGLGSPIEFVQPEKGINRYFVAEQSGVVHIIQDGKRLADPLMDLRSKMIKLEEGFEERGLLGFALHPQFNVNGRLYVSYSAPLAMSAPEGWNYTRKISEYTVDWQDPNRVDLKSERVLLALDWPSRKHNGGALAFGPDGYLYIGVGDGGGAHGVGKKVLWSAFEVQKKQLHWDRLAQDITSLFGSILRIDVDGGFPGYGIPSSNPFVGTPGRDEIYMWGVRNPYRIAFDREENGKFLAALVGETLWESVYLADKPGNFGWPIREGRHCIERLNPRNPPLANNCSLKDAQGYRLQNPIVEYPNMQVMHPDTKYKATGVGTAVVGARFYRGTSFPQLQGLALFADWSADFRMPSGQLFAAKPSKVAGDLWSFEKLRVFSSRIISLAEDAEGELVILTNDELGPFGSSGKVFRLVP